MQNLRPFDEQARLRRVVTEINRVLDEMGEFRLAIRDIETREGREAARASIRAFVSTFEGEVPAAFQSAIRELLSLLDLLDREAEAAVAGPAATGRAPPARAVEVEPSQDFERVSMVTIESLANLGTELVLHSFLLGDIAASGREQVRLMGGTPPTFGLGLIPGPPQAPPSLGGGAVSIGQIGPIGPFNVPAGSDLGGIDYEALSEIMASRIREAFRASGGTGPPVIGG